ncbi:MAG: hypothetical protein ACRDQ0_10900 [Pseudonocardia sp.]
MDNRRAPRDPDQAKPRLQDQLNTADPPTHQPRSRQSEALRAAQWLLRSRLDPRVCDDVSPRWLAAQIRGSHLLDQHHWTWNDLADQLHGYPQYTHLPRHIHNPRAWIRTRITHATPTLSPTKLRIIHHIERNSPLCRQRRQAEAERAQRAEITARRNAINNCELCDELGWLHVAADVPTARCNHDTGTGGW